MSDFKYSTPYWRDSQTISAPGISAYTGTYFFILNPNEVRAAVKVYFYDLSGKAYDDMPPVDMLTLPNSVLDFRIVDIISFANPAYRQSNNLRTGWMKIVSDVPLVISGKIVSGTVNSQNIRVEDSWSIPFEALPDVSLDLDTINKKILVENHTPIANNTLEEYLKRRRQK